MPLFDVIGLGAEKYAVVIDIGAAYTKCGFASETSPRHIIRSVITHTINGETETVDVVSHEQDKRPDELYAILLSSSNLFQVPSCKPTGQTSCYL